MSTESRRHGSAADRGSADAYYGRPKRPHKYVGATGTSPLVEEKDLTPEEIEEYNYAYDNETDRKHWD